ncbi:unnamed protein product [Bursaphelenchus okinawaensis]|uniref:[histone H3]-lysine(27) N-trimethyltransferase n=1 Tax=Bursaphelenchus okinawaensis TaxID=465554 RepID=A0A811KE39_9BILA|nr:unnamed protein product [Bursaphelenchus okinawaensis]CAG9099293.1 unnamed protein product [Bursaphelenchus okinawaensis]
MARRYALPMSSASSSGYQKVARRVGRPPTKSVRSTTASSIATRSKNSGSSASETTSQPSTQSEVTPERVIRPRKRPAKPGRPAIPAKRRGRPKQRQRRVKQVVKEIEDEETGEEEDEASDSGESVDSMEGMNPLWEENIMACYEKARNSYEAFNYTEGAAAFKLSLTQHHSFKPRPPKKHITFRLNKMPEQKKRKNYVHLERIAPLPPMIFFTLTEMNIMADDQYTLSHVPYMGDQEEERLTKELLEVFPDGIHGTKTGCGQYINDYILYYTVKHAIQALPDIPFPKLLRIIYELFPNKFQKNELLEVYPDLKARFDKHLIQDPMPTDENGLQIQNNSPQDLLHSYQVLQCYKCTLYDCPHHERLDEKQQITLMSRHDDRTNPYVPMPCTGNCYLAKRRVLLPQRRSPNKRNVKLEIQVKPVNWSPQEESMLAVMRMSGITDCCIIARALQVEPGQTEKTCNDVYAYFKRQSPISPIVNVKREPVIKKKGNDLHRKFRAIKWSVDGEVKNKYAYWPCVHEGPCSEANCSCYSRDKICTKYCKCFHEDCKIQFPGCRCTPGNCRTRQCPCYYASWECDPDLCKGCRCEPDDSGMPNEKCKNICFQRGLQKKLSVRPSQVAGWGCFADETLYRHDFISEYCGEIVSVSESERRGKIYDKIKCSYLFELNQDYQVDATRKGNLIRFANHSSNPNCYAKVVVANTDHRIGIFASRQIEKGEELFFDYAYNKTHQLEFLNKELDKNHQVITMTERDLKNRKKKK